MDQNINGKKITVNEAYSDPSWLYDIRGFLILKFSYRSSLITQIIFFSKNLGPRHLEIAIGSGTLFDLILKWRKIKKLPNIEIFGFDYAEKMIKAAQRRFSKIKNIHLTQADASHLNFVDGYFDTAQIANAFHCLPDVQKSLDEIYRVLKPNGIFSGNSLLFPTTSNLLNYIATRINIWGIRKGILITPYSISEARNLIEGAGFKIEFEKVSGNCYFFVAKKFTRLA